jgi:hypothetical protein
VEDIPACVDQGTLGLREELNENIDATQADIQLVMKSIDTWTRSLKDDIADTKNDCHEAIGNMRKELHEELGLMFQVEARTTKAITEAARCEFQPHLKEVEALAESKRGTGTGAGVAKPPKLLDSPQRGMRSSRRV